MTFRPMKPLCIGDRTRNSIATATVPVPESAPVFLSVPSSASVIASASTSAQAPVNGDCEEGVVNNHGSGEGGGAEESNSKK